MGEKDILDISMLAVTSFSLERKILGFSVHFEISIRGRSTDAQLERKRDL
jgi:hypothetical protein